MADAYICAETAIPPAPKAKSKGDRAAQERRRRAKIEAARAAVLAGTYAAGSFHRESTCQGCGKLFPIIKADRKGKFCSRVCAGLDGDKAGAAERRLAAKSRAKRAARVARWEALGVDSEAVCASCGCAYDRKIATQRYCSEACRSQGQRDSEAARNCERSSRPTVSCRHCGVTFVPPYGDKRRAYCSTRCARWAPARSAKARRRVVAKGLPHEPVNPMKVFERDGWRCHLCGVRTPRRLRGSTDPRAPELDHIVPVAAGGGHTYANTACACRKCNGEKGATPKGQPWLWSIAA